MFSYKLLFIFLIFICEAICQAKGLECLETQFACSDGTSCVSQSYYCDGVPDCVDGSDEPESCPPVSCQPRQFQCKKTGKCILQDFMCDHEIDCGGEGIDSSDEDPELCGKDSPCPGGQLPCKDGTCLPILQHCDGKLDCSDNSDEGPFCEAKECLQVNCSYDCRMTWKGASCFCEEGQEALGTLCKDINECAVNEPCDQMCLNLPGTYNCTCMPGYKMIPPSTCLAINDPPSEPTSLLISTAESILHLKMDGEQINRLSALDSYALDFNHRNKSMCWISHTSTPARSSRSTPSSMQCAQLDMKQGWILPVPDMIPYSSVDKIALDWSTGNWYYVDESKETVFLCRVQGTEQFCRAIFVTKRNKPRGVALDPSAGFMFVISSGSAPAKLERSLLDGSKRKIIADTKIIYPDCPTLDYPNRHVYWVDTYLNHVERCDYDGGNRKTIYQSFTLNSLTSLSLMQTTVYATLGNDNTLVSFDRRNPQKIDVIKKFKSRPYSVSVYHRMKQPLYTNITVDAHPCTKQQPCSHFCIPLSTSPYYKCICRPGYQLDIRSKCKLSRNKNILLVGQQNPGMIRGLDIDDPLSEVMVPISGVVRPTTMDFDLKSQYLYFADSQSLKIERVKLFQAKPIKEDFITEGLNKVEGLSVDWVARNIYWTDEGLQAIYVASLDKPEYKQTLIRQNTTNVRSLVVEPRLAYLFWSTWSDKEAGPTNQAAIFAGWMDGSNVEQIVGSDLTWPNGLTFDYENNKLYWSDTSLNRIESLKIQIVYDKITVIERKTVVMSGQFVSRPYGLTLYKQSLFWTEFINGNIIYHDLETNKTSAKAKDLPQLFEIKVYTAGKQKKVSSACDSLECIQLCLLTPGAGICSCMDGYSLQDDQISCTKNPNATDPVCTEAEFLCPGNPGHCIDRKHLCDLTEDCENGADEAPKVCHEKVCLENQFMCKDHHQCIEEDWLCDGDRDCMDGSDELKDRCANITCQPDNHFQCVVDGLCVPKEDECNGVADCEDGSDEHLGCFNVTCLTNQFKCDAYRCFPELYKCDGEVDCMDGSDEAGCPGYCPEDYFLCSIDMTCIPGNVTCNGPKDCPDGEDERDCPDEVPTICQSKEFSCGDGTCLPRKYMCDGSSDCLDGSDENNCSITCGPEQFACTTGHQCIQKNKKCDGRDDCEDNSDENDCKHEFQCVYPYFQCDHQSDEYEPQCLDPAKLCNYRSECLDGSDEGLLCSDNDCASISIECSHTCYNSPDGHRCGCPTGMHLDASRVNCTELKPCSQWGTCSQFCTQISPAQHKCYCHEDYFLLSDKRTCRSKDLTDPLIVYTVRRQLKAINSTTGVIKTLMSNLKTTVALDFYLDGTITTLFWTDLTDGCIYSGILSEDLVTNVRCIVFIGRARAEGLAVDWVGKNLYWIDSVFGQIEVATLEGKFRTTLVSKGMENPRYLILDPEEGLMFCSDWVDGKASIHAYPMDGDETEHRIVYDVSKYDGAWPNGLALDYVVKRIYWIDARSDSIHTTFYDGSDHREISRGHKYMSHPFDIAIYESLFYWTDWRSNQILRANRWNGSDITVMDKTVTRPFAIKVVHSSLQPKLSKQHPCEKDNGGCSHICLLGANFTASCACPNIMKISADNKNCEKTKVMMLYSIKNELRGVEMTRPYHHLIPPILFPNIVHPKHLEFSASTKEVFWLDIAGISWPHNRVIRRVKLHGNSNEADIIIDASSYEIERNKVPNLSRTETAGQPPSQQPQDIDDDSASLNIEAGGVSLDWMSNTIYYTSVNHGTGRRHSTIKAAKLDGSKVVKIRDLQATAMDLVVVPDKGIMFWHEVDMETGEESLKSSRMDGVDEQSLYTVDRGEDMKEDKTILQHLTYAADKHILYWLNNLRLFKHDLITGEVSQVPEVTFPNITVLKYYNNSFYFGGAHEDSWAITAKDLNNTETMVKKLDKEPLALVIYDADSQTGSNKCSNKNGGCEHVCVPVSKEEIKCMCSIGYYIDQADDTKCRPVDNFLMYAADGRVQGLSIDKQRQDILVPLTNEGHATGLDYLAAEQLIFWVDNGVGEIWRVKRDGSGKKKLLSNLESPVGLAVDWVARNIYWSDDRTDVIEVCTIDGQHRKVIISRDLVRPASLEVSPEDGLLFWIDTDITAAKLEKAYLDGTNRTVLSTDMKMNSVSDISIDPQGKWIYLTYNFASNGESFGRISFDGDRNETFRPKSSEMVRSPVSLTYYDDKIWWIDVDYKGGSISYFQLGATDEVNVVKRNLGGRTSLWDLKMYSPSLQSDIGNNPCSNNSFCSHLCLYNGEEGKCHCSFKKLGDDGRTCVDYSAFLIYSGVHYIESLSLEQNSADNQPFPKIQNTTYLKNVISLAYNYEQQEIYYTDIHTESISAVFFNGSGLRQILSLHGSAEGLAFDSLSNVLYWTSAGDSSIKKIDMARHPYIVDLVVQLRPEDKPRGIDINMCTKQIFWTNWNKENPSIQRAYSTGYDMKSIITKDIRMPNGIAIDVQNTYDTQIQRLFWADAQLDKIEMCDLDGGNCKIVASSILQHPFDIAVYGDSLFYTDWKNHSVVRVNKLSGEDAVVIKNNIMRPMGLATVSSDPVKCYSSSCSYLNGGCEDICHDEGPGKVTCSCLSGRHLLPDGRRCTSSIASCHANQFQCLGSSTEANKNFCIPYELTCDGLKHCPDGSDERIEFCLLRECPKSFFKCANSKCIKESLKCNGIDNCGDFSDETLCPCKDPENEFKCNIGPCISKNKVCNLEKDCPDASDEKHCEGARNCTASRAAQTVDEDEIGELIPCEHTTACILPSWKCDGVDDCWDNSDEEMCASISYQNSICPNGTFACADGKCINAGWVCDRDHDCAQGEDEQNCTHTCGPNQFQCKQQKQCIDSVWRCDGTPDCDDKSDEDDECEASGCQGYQCPNQGPCISLNRLCDGVQDCPHDQGGLSGDEDPHHCTNFCSKAEFRCADGKCIPSFYYCDGASDCVDGSDEPASCENKVCPQGYVKCRSSRSCIVKDGLCNGVQDCSDASDEDPSYCILFSQEASYWNGCKFSEFQCSNGSCVDLSLVCNGNNDCGDFSDEMNCTHYLGDTRMVKKSCKPGYHLSSSGVCKAKSSVQPKILFSNRYYIRLVDFLGNSEIFAKNQTNAVAIDYDYRTKCAFWSDITKSGSSLRKLCIKDKTTEILNLATLQNPDGIAVDWVARNLYWCDKGSDTIEVSNLDGKFRKVLVHENLQEPRALTVDPIHGYLYWTDWGDNPHIGRAAMDGSGQEIIISNNLAWPNALTIAYDTEELFFGDAYLKYIAYSNLDGSDIRIVASAAKNPGVNLDHIFALTVFENHIYWSDWESGSIERCTKYTCEDSVTIINTVHSPMDLVIYHPMRQPPVQNNPCLNNGGCHGLCLLVPGDNDALTRVCACPEDFVLQDDGVSCRSNCSASKFQCEESLKCIPFWWKCDGQKDCEDGSDEPEDCEDFVCKPGQFQCKNRECIHPAQFCNGNSDCADMSDEIACNEYECMKNQYKCQFSDSVSSFCIETTKQCNGIKECPLGDDENGCPETTCDEGYFQCNNGACIPGVWVCDKDNDCKDNSDEASFCLAEERSCEEGHFKCDNGRCIPESWLCDGDIDCFNKEDENMNCTETISVACDDTDFRCKSGHCIPGRWRCDYEEDCADGSDELNCSDDEYRACSEDEQPCHNGKCVHISKWCDGHVDCDLDDKTDERFCQLTCSENEFRCHYPPICIHSKWRCDLERDCSDGSDEINCPTILCKPGQFSCHASQCHSGNCNTTMECLDPKFLCDGEKDCANGADEEPGACKESLCGVNMFQCIGSGYCVPWDKVCNGKNDCSDSSDETTESCNKVKCSADPSKFMCDGLKCIDKSLVCDGSMDCLDGTDESNCSQVACQFGACSQICQVKSSRTEHKSICLCAPGYQQTHHKQYCKAKGKDPVLLLANENTIRHINPSRFHKIVELSGGHSNHDGFGQLKIEAIDVAYDNNNPIMFISLRNNGTILYIKFSADSEAARVTRGVNNDETDVLVDNAGIPKGLAVDWINKNIYWINEQTASVHLVNYETKNKLTIIKNSLILPNDIAVDPDIGKLFISDAGTKPIIFMARLDGSDLRPLVSDDMSWPVSLAIDYPARRLYWTDMKKRTIESVRLDGTERREIVKLEAKMGKPFKLDVFEDTVFFTTFQFNKILRINKFGNGSIMNIAEELMSVTDLVMMQENKHDSVYISNPCETAPCAKYGPNAICTSIPDQHQSLMSRCMCADGYYLKNNKCVSLAKNEVLTCSTLNCHAGTCHMLHGFPHCICDPSYTGKYCETFICSQFCENDAKCLPVHEEDKPARATCICREGFTGTRCEVNMKECLDYCHNNSTCLFNPESEKLECRCNHPFTGERCDECVNIACPLGKCALNADEVAVCKEDLCKNFECLHGGTCYIDQSSDQPQCKCTDSMYNGRRCEMDKCQTSYCKNGGTGFREDGKCMCRCTNEFTGPLCEMPLRDLSDCNSVGNCLNGGVCVEFNQTKICSCPLDFYGQNCETKIEAQLNPCREVNCHNGGVCSVTAEPGEYKAQCLCDEKYKGLYCMEKNRCYKHCLNGGECFDDGKTVRCRCPEGWSGGRCSMNFNGGSKESLDNDAINSLTVTIVTVSIVALALLAALIYLIVFLVQRRHLSLGFKHYRMNDSVSGGGRRSEAEFSNRMYLQDDFDDLEEHGPFSDVGPLASNFVNPVYETMFLNSRPSIIKDENLVNPELLEISGTESERSGLLRANDTPPTDGRPVIHTDSD